MLINGAEATSTLGGLDASSAGSTFVVFSGDASDDSAD